MLMYCTKCIKGRCNWFSL